MKRLFVFLAVFLGLSMQVASAADKEKPKKESTSSPQPSPPEVPGIIERPLTPNTGRYIQHGTDIPGVPSEPPKEREKLKKEGKK